MNKLRNTTHEAFRPLILYFPDSRNEASKKRSDWDFPRMLIVMSVKLTLTNELLKVNSALKPIFSVIEDQCSGR